jgi:hypothetical protein
MTDIHRSSATSNKNFDDFPLIDIHGRKHRFRRSQNRKGYYDILDCYPLTDGRVPNRDGLLPDAIYYTNEEVADLITQAEERQRRLEKTEQSLKEYIEFRRSWFRKPGKGGKVRLQKQKKEVAK